MKVFKKLSNITKSMKTSVSPTAFLSSLNMIVSWENV